jgi:nucleotidyltransferase/DNA polymerase involved in DNA repair
MEKERAIIHIDGDSFFVACEMLSRPDLVGKAVVTGEERGIASAMSTEAKRLGVTRGMPVFQIRRDFPQVVILKSHYGLYEQYNQKMLAVAREFSDNVEDYSIDECFLDISDEGETWEDKVVIAKKLKDTLQIKLGLTFSLGLAPTKVLAKVASKNNKPNGFTAMKVEDSHGFLAKVDIGDVWGIGWASAPRFRSAGISTALDFVRKSEVWVKQHLDSPHQALWYELCGKSLMEVGNHHEQLKSLQSTRTFPKASNDREYVFSHLSRNIEIACSRMRHAGLYTKRISFFVKDHNTHKRLWVDQELIEDTNLAHEIISQVRQSFSKLLIKGATYRSTGITCHALKNKEDIPLSLFGKSFENEELYEAMDSVTEKFGDHSILLASSMNAVKSFQDIDKSKILIRQKLFSIPFLGDIY